MAKSNAERQRAYRQRHLSDTEGRGERINTVIDLSAKRALERLAACYGVTQREMLERVIADAQADLLERLTPDQERAFYESELALPGVMQ